MKQLKQEIEDLLSTGDGKYAILRLAEEIDEINKFLEKLGR